MIFVALSYSDKYRYLKVDFNSKVFILAVFCNIVLFLPGSVEVVFTTITY